jgi:cytochrome c oxidase cbb3-type subunit 4
VSYETLRHFADSHALAAMAVLYLALVGWAFRPGARSANRHAATMIFDEENSDG